MSCGRHTLAGALFGVGLALAHLSSAIAQGLTSDERAAIDAFVSGAVERSGAPGLSLVVTRGGEIVAAAGYGEDANGAPMTAQTPLYIGSTSKAFTALAVMQLVEAGRIGLDATVQSQLPEFAMNDPRAAAITVRQLLSHASGMADVTFQEWSLPQPRTLEETVAALRPARLAADPGTRFSYHNPNYYTAARLVEVASGQAFGEYMREHVFAPLGMASTKTVAFVDEARDGVALGHISAFGHAFAVPSAPFFVDGAGGVLTTAEDMGAWLISQSGGGGVSNGTRIVSTQGLAETHRASITPNYALGWNTNRDGRLSHTGGLPTFSSYVSFTEEGDGVAVLTNVYSAPSREIGLGVLDILAGREPAPIGDPMAPRADIAFAVVIAAALALAIFDLSRIGRWTSRRRLWPTWRIALSLAPQVVLVLIVFAGIPFLVSRVESWSWIWMAYWIPVATAMVLTLGGLAALVAVVRAAALFWEPGASRPRR